MSEAVLGTFSEVRFVKTRSVMQIIVEVPIEAADSALKALGGIPQPSEERWIGLALAPKERSQRHKDEPDGAKISIENLGTLIKPHRPFDSLPLSQQSGIRCNDQQFQDFLLLAGRFSIEDDESDAASEAALAVRNYCGIISRAELDTNDIAAAKWRKLEEEFQAYLTDLRYAGTARL